MTGIKICGITTADALEASIAARADFAGFNRFPPSPRHADDATLRALTQAAAGRIGRVGLFVDADDALIAETLAAASFEALQLHGGESPERVAQIKARFGVPVWKVISVSAASDIDRAGGYSGAADLILFDARTPIGSDLTGGMGLRFDWSLLSGWRGGITWGLAGGLTPANVAQAIAQTGAPLVDTASGVESAVGVKDTGRIAAFCEAVRQA
ncbi:phosphoribosylanthranilate isomerase [Leptolyngbya sp. 15MV]|nr:phosphoribosylanthranilate isomerase [Leptolyngbya sp. 15MV]